MPKLSCSERKLGETLSKLAKASANLTQDYFFLKIEEYNLEIK